MNNYTRAPCHLTQVIGLMQQTLIYDDTFNEIFHAFEEVDDNICTDLRK